MSLLENLKRFEQGKESGTTKKHNKQEVKANEIEHQIKEKEQDSIDPEMEIAIEENQFKSDYEAWKYLFKIQAESYRPVRNGLIYMAHNYETVVRAIARKAQDRFSPVQRNYKTGTNRFQEGLYSQEDLFQDVAEFATKNAIAKNKAKNKVLNVTQNMMQKYSRERAKMHSESVESLQESIEYGVYPEFILWQDMTRGQEEDESRKRIEQLLDILPDQLGRIMTYLFAGYDKNTIARKERLATSKIAQLITELQSVIVKSNILDRNVLSQYVYIPPQDDLEEFEEAI